MEPLKPWMLSPDQIEAFNQAIQTMRRGTAGEPVSVKMNTGRIINPNVEMSRGY